MKKLLFAFAAVLLVSAPLGAWADDLTTTPTPSPANSQPIPTPLTDAQPVILGHVVGTSSHSITVSTPEAERITFEFDSRTVMPRELIEGTPVRVEFHLMDNGIHHAGRITALERGSKDWMRLEEMRTSAAESPDQSMTSENPSTETTPSDMSASTTTENHTNEIVSPTTDENTNATTDEHANTETRDENRNQLPQTASEQPWLLALGLAAAAVAVGIGLRRRAQT